MGSIVHLRLHTGDEPAPLLLRAAAAAGRDVEATTARTALAFGFDDSAAASSNGTKRAQWLPTSRSTASTGHRARQGLGARCALSPREGPAGWRSVVRSRSGAEVALWQQKR
jgi:hypothetical protein